MCSGLRGGMANEPARPPNEPLKYQRAERRTEQVRARAVCQIEGIVSPALPPACAAGRRLLLGEILLTSIARARGGRPLAAGGAPAGTDRRRAGLRRAIF